MNRLFNKLIIELSRQNYDMLIEFYNHIHDSEQCMKGIFVKWDWYLMRESLSFVILYQIT